MSREPLRSIQDQGWVVLPEILSPGELREVRAALDPLLGRRALGRNNFEGFETERVYSLVAQGAIFERLVLQPRVLELCDALLDPGYLLTASQAIQIHPGETPQPFHADDTFYPLPRPRNAVSVSTIFAIDPFTIENGATQIVPGSHTWSDAEIAVVVERLAREFGTAPRHERVPRAAAPAEETIGAAKIVDVVMPAGSAVVFLGTLVHRGGQNHGAAPRLALSNQYCAPWARQQENFFLSIPREQAREMPERVRELLGYSIHPPFMGHAAGRHPGKALA